MNTDNQRPPSVAVLGIPFDENSSFLRGAAKAPDAIREALYSESANLCAENGLDLGVSNDWLDAGNVDPGEKADAFDRIEEAVSDIVSRGLRPVSLGGDHSITYAIVRAVSATHENLTVLQLDAHPDLYDELDGNRYSHACPFARIMDEGLIERLVQVGIRTMTSHQREQADRFGVEVVEAEAWHRGYALNLEGPLYVSLDMDVFDPAFAPGVSHHEPGGLSTRDVLSIVQAIDVPLVGSDIVELNPDRDPNGMTAMVAAKCLKELLAKMLSQTTQ